MSRLYPRPVRGGEPGRIAFVLSGGGRLEAVRVGMRRARSEHKIHPDFLIGTSVGAVNAAWMAGRPESGSMDELTEIWLGLRRQDVFPLSPLTSARGLLGRTNHFISNASLGAILERHIPYKRLEQAAVPVHVVVTELKSGRATILTSGPAVPDLLASCAVPRVFPPDAVGHRHYVDAGAAYPARSTLPVDLCAQKSSLLPRRNRSQQR